MEKVTLVHRTTRKSGMTKLRFRLRDGRNVQLYYKSSIIVDIGRVNVLLSKLDSNLEVKRNVKVWDKELLALLQAQKEKMLQVYQRMKEKQIPINAESFDREMQLKPRDGTTMENEDSFLSVFWSLTEKQLQDGVIGPSRYKHSVVIWKALERFFEIFGYTNIRAEEITPELLMEFRNFFVDEYRYVGSYAHLYQGMKTCNIPHKPRGNNTVVTALNRLQAVFAELECKDLVLKSPFRKLGKERRRIVMRERYDEPVYLLKDEFLSVLHCRVPDEYQEVKKVFLLQTALGCRISDFRNLKKENVSISSEGIPYVHYLPLKTLKRQNDYREICTPLIKYAYDMVLKDGFSYKIPNQLSGKEGYNQKLKELMKLCGIDRLCTVFDEVQNRNRYVPLFELASSKLCRKTHIDLMNKVQINKYAAGLHQYGSSAVDRYTSMELKDRFILMCAAFDQPFFIAQT